MSIVRRPRWVVLCTHSHVVVIGVSITAFGLKLTLISAILLSRFSLNMSRFFAYLELEKCALCALLSVKLNSNDSATSIQCSTKLIRSAKLSDCVSFACLFVPRGVRDKDIPG